MQFSVDDESEYTCPVQLPAAMQVPLFPSEVVQLFGVEVGAAVVVGFAVVVGIGVGADLHVPPLLFGVHP